MEMILMSKSEQKRLAVMAQVTAGKLSLSGASELLGLSYRQTKRVLSRYRAEGDRGLVHGLRGKRSNRPSDAVLRVIAGSLGGSKLLDELSADGTPWTAPFPPKSY